ncbi:MAG: PepSY domain-containing protein [Pseudomonadota bacterium]
MLDFKMFCAATICGAFLVASDAHAGPSCTSEPSDTWLSEAQMRTLIDASGYIVDVFKTTSGNCYEIYGRTDDGKRVEVYYHPITGEVIRETVR